MLFFLADAAANATPTIIPGGGDVAAWIEVLIRQGPTAVIAFFLLFKLGPKTDAQTRAYDRQTRMIGNAILALKRLDAALKEKVQSDLEDSPSGASADNP